MLLANGPMITDWLTAIGTVLGAVGTIAAVTVALAIAIRDNRRLVAEARDREAAVARLVTATLRRDVGLTFLEIRNDSPETVYHPVVELSVCGPVSYLVTGQKVEERNGRFVAVDSRDEAVGFVPPHESARLLVETKGTTGGSVTVKLGFTDAAGRQWVRLGDAPPRRELTA